MKIECVILPMLQKNHIYGYPCRCLILERVKDVFDMLCKISEYFYKSIENYNGAKYLMFCSGRTRL